tara:strand:- start:731 stop:1519 length:789 start_codon:yes stop_codon:yes gene_type:complete
MKIAIIGIGFVGNALMYSFLKKNINCIFYDKYKNIGNLQECLQSNICFLCLPSNLNSENMYNLSELYETCEFLYHNMYTGVIVIKSTVLPNTLKQLIVKYNTLKFVSNPEFLSAKTANEDFHNQSHIVVGAENKDYSQIVCDFYKEHYPKACISSCSSNEAESMKIFCNSFYSVKIQFFNELYLLCNKLDCNYNTVRDLMLKNNWIHPMHTNVPGHDGKLSYGGGCLPKDIQALMQFMKTNNSMHKILESCIEERNIIRNKD